MAKFRHQFKLTQKMGEGAEATIVSTPLEDARSEESATLLEEVLKTSISVWHKHLRSAFRHAKSRFADVVWEVNEFLDEAGEHTQDPIEVWGHKAILYARVPANYRVRHFPCKDSNGTSPLPYASVSGGFKRPEWQERLLAMDPEPFDSSHASCLLHLTVSDFDHKSLTRVIRGLYAEYENPKEQASLSDVTEPSLQGKALLTGLQQDLLFAWRARLNSDVRIVLQQDEPSTAVFWSHRFILASRSPYFKNVLTKCAISEKEGPPSNEVLALELPTPTFTPAGFFFTLGFIYTGTLNYYRRTYDLATAFSIFRGSRYLKIPTLTAEIKARIVEEMMHGLFHAFVADEEYQNLVGEKWNGAVEMGGCRCRQCSRRIPRMLEFALAEDIKDDVFLRGARRATVALFGEGWCTTEFGGLSRTTKDFAMKDIKQLITATNVFPLLFTAEAALLKLETKDVAELANDLKAKDIIADVRQELDQMLFTVPDSCFESEEWTLIMKEHLSDDPDKKNQADNKLGWTLKALSRCVDDKHARALRRSLAQLLVSPHGNETLLHHSSGFRTKIEKAIQGLLAVIPDASPSMPESEPQLESGNPTTFTVISTRSRSSSTSSIYSNISAQGSTFNPERFDLSYRAYPADLDAANISLYSYPSSRTISTDYGLFYTRMAPSMDSISNTSDDQE